MQNLLRRFCKRRIQKPEFRIQNWNPLTGNVFCYSDSCILYSDFSLANTPEGFCKSLKDKSAFPLDILLDTSPPHGYALHTVGMATPLLGLLDGYDVSLWVHVITVKKVLKRDIQFIMELQLRLPELPNAGVCLQFNRRHLSLIHI